MNFIRTSIYSGISTAISLITKLISNKIIAVYLGSSGMFLIGQLKDILKIFYTISTLGVETGTTKYTSELKNKKNEFSNLISTTFKIHLFSSIILMALIIIFYKSLVLSLSVEIEETNQNLLKYFLLISIISFSIQTFIMSVLNGLKKIKIYILINITATIVSAISLILLVIKYSIIGAFFGLIISPIITLIIAIIICLINKPFSFNFINSIFKQNYFKKLSNYTIMAITGPICLISATFFIRYFVYEEYDSNHAGSWEAMWRISGIYLLFLTTTFKFYLVPTFSNLKNEKLKKEVFKIWKTTLPIIILITALVYFCKDLLIELLFTSEFYLINTLILFHLLGDIIKINCWILGNILIAKARTKSFILFQVEWSIIFIILSIIFSNIYGYVGLGIAYFSTYLIHFIFLNLYFRKLLWKS